METVKEKLFHSKTLEETFTILNTSPDGIEESEAYTRLSFYGFNKLLEGKKRTLFHMLFDQFKNVMVLILLIAAAISGFMHEITDTVIILAIIIINAVLGVFQESKAEKALEALKELSSPQAKVKRSGRIDTIKAVEIVPGDVVYLEAGDYVPADMRLIEAFNLKIDESALTGESEAVLKNTAPLENRELATGDRINMAYSGSIVTYGRGTGLVTETGMNTEVGKIAGYITKDDHRQTPLQSKLEELGKYLSLAIIIIASVIFLSGILQGKNYLDMFLIAVSLAVAAIPEGMPAIVTIVLALGVQKMSKKNAIIRKLPAIETLGSTELICSDKTGTLTRNKMTVTEIFVSEIHIKDSDIQNNPDDIETLMEIMNLCNDSKLSYENQNPLIIGDPTETALVQYCLSMSQDKNKMEKEMSRIGEIPFDSERKLMTTLHKYKNNIRIMTKGAPDILFEKCTHILKNGNVLEITEHDISVLKNIYMDMAGRALRALAYAYKDIDFLPEHIKQDEIESNLIFVGITGMIDPPRPEAKKAVEICKKAGIRPVMITGDHRDTAAAIAFELGIISNKSEIITGAELDKIDDVSLKEEVYKYNVYARVSPQHKVRIVTAWK